MLRALRLPQPIPESEREVVLEAAARDLRLDGRSLREARACELSVARASSTHSLAKVDLGGTRAVCDVSAELVPPYPDRPNEGLFHVVSSYSPAASPKAASGGRGGGAGAPLHMVERSIHNSRALDLETLCVASGVAVWDVRCAVTVLNDCGNALDAASLAAMAALLHFRRSAVTCVGDEIQVHSLEDRAPLPLAVHHVPLCVTFSLLSPLASASSKDEGFLALLDPSHREEAVADGVVTVVLNAHREVCGLAKTGDPPVSASDLVRLAQIAATARAERGALLERALQESTFV